MKAYKYFLATAALAASFSASASAQVSGSIGGGGGPYLSFSGAEDCNPVVNTCALGGYTINGGNILSGSQPTDAEPAGNFGELYLSAGPTSGSPSKLDFGGGIYYVSFLWGSPDLYNSLRVNYGAGMFTDFDVTGLGFSTTDGNQSVSTYVQFSRSEGDITSLEFGSTTNAFEVSNFNVSTVPEPSTYVLLAAGLAALGFASKRRKQA